MSIEKSSLTCDLYFLKLLKHLPVNAWTNMVEDSCCYQSNDMEIWILLPVASAKPRLSFSFTVATHLLIFQRSNQPCFPPISQLTRSKQYRIQGNNHQNVERIRTPSPTNRKATTSKAVVQNLHSRDNLRWDRRIVSHIMHLPLCS